MAKLLDFGNIRDAADFASVLRHYGFDFPDGRIQLKLHCPFHDEGTPSLSVNLEKKLFRCFGCDASGNPIDFVRRMEKKRQAGRDPGTYKAALKLAEICGLTDIEKEPSGKGSTNAAATPPKPPLQTRYRAQTGKDASGAQSPLYEAPDAPEPIAAEAHGDVVDINPPLSFSLRLDAEHPYLTERGLSSETIEQFGLGFASRGLMKGRVCVPIHNEHDELVAYAGRWVGSDETIPEHEGKWKLPPRFEKSRVLFNLHRVDEPLHLVVVEGFFGAIRLHALGYPVVALMGRALSEQHIELLESAGTRHLLLMLDGDEPGRTATAAILGRLADASFLTLAAGLPTGMQPDTANETTVRELLRITGLKPRT